jgi:hypothetical protein
MEEKLEREKKRMTEEAQESATISVIEAMYDMAKEASAAGFSLPTWDVKEWARMLGKPEETDQARDQTGAGGSGEGDGMQMGDEGDLNA